ncbi:hypothetical protein CBL_12065 [Carabus blaptoides fortunei]
MHEKSSDAKCVAQVVVEPFVPFIPAAGVPQGSVLSLLLYALYSVDLPQSTEHGDRLVQYADDTAYFNSARNSHIVTEQLQALMIRLEEWMRTWRNRPNPTRTQLILFIPKKFRKKHVSEERVHLHLWDHTIRPTLILKDGWFCRLYLQPHQNKIVENETKQHTVERRHEREKELNNARHNASAILSGIICFHFFATRGVSAYYIDKYASTAISLLSSKKNWLNT